MGHLPIASRPVGIGAQGDFVSPMCSLEGVSTAFETLARQVGLPGGTFFLYRKRFIALSGDVVSIMTVYPNAYPVSI